MLGGRFASAIGVLATVAVVAVPSPRAALPHVTFIGDSVPGAIQYDAAARGILSQGVDLDLEIATCRRVGGESCPFDGARAPTVLQLVQQMGPKLGPTVVVAVGYNDPADEYAQSIEDTLAELKQAGVEHVLWATLRAARHPILTMNDAIAAAATHHPEVTVIDWNLYSRSHPEWFQSDGVHLAGYGARAMATLVHNALVELGLARPPLAIATSALPDARAGKPYAARLVARGGLAPYRWSEAGRLPHGLRLAPSGRVSGTVRAAPGLFRLSVHVRDADGVATVHGVTLRVRR